MTFAFSSLLIVLLILPGFFFVRSYFSYPFYKRYSTKDSFEYFSLIVFWGIMLQAFFGFLIQILPVTYTISFSDIAYILINNADFEKTIEAVNNVKKYSVWIVLYNIIVNGWAWIGGI